MVFGLKVRICEPQHIVCPSHHTSTRTPIHHLAPPSTTLHHHTGYHWLHAVAAIFNVCIGLVIDRHDFTHVFGNQRSPRIYLYKTDAESHYDALLPNPLPNCIQQSHHASSSDVDWVVPPEPARERRRRTPRMQCSRPYDAVASSKASPPRRITLRGTMAVKMVAVTW